jgi:hypothetical protein
MSDAREVLSALIDREPVDPEALAVLLEDPGNRRLLVDFVRVRAAVTAPEADVHDAYSGRDLRRPASDRSGGSRWLRAAAVFLLLAAGAGGGAWLERYVAAEKPPQPDRVVRFQPGVDWAQIGGSQ